MNIRTALTESTEKLKATGNSSSRLDAEVILMNLLGIDRAYLYTHADEKLSKETYEKFLEQIDERCKYRPVAYITGHKEFMGLEFYVDENVLIPRPDTEILVETALKNIKRGERVRVLDIGTGSGAIGLSLKKMRPEIDLTVTDISRAALDVARYNAERLNILAKFIESDLFENVSSQFDIIVSNPPYIPSAEIEGLDQDIVNWEPRLALDGGENGYHFYQLLVSRARDYLESSGRLLLEVGSTQARSVSRLLNNYGYQNIEVVKDLSDLERVVSAQWT